MSLGIIRLFAYCLRKIEGFTEKTVKLPHLGAIRRIPDL
jgi:hypothetical protein